MLQKALVIVAMILGASAAEAQAQVKQQPFVGLSAVAPRIEGAAPATTIHGGYALVVPVTKRVFLRPVVTIGLVNPTTEGKKPFPSVSGGGLVGVKINSLFSTLAGGGITVNFVPNQPAVRLPTFLVSTASKISDHWGIYTPVAITAKTASVMIQLGWTGALRK